MIKATVMLAGTLLFVEGNLIAGSGGHKGKGHKNHGAQCSSLSQEDCATHKHCVVQDGKCVRKGGDHQEGGAGHHARRKPNEAAAEHPLSEASPPSQGSSSDGEVSHE